MKSCLFTLITGFLLLSNAVSAADSATAEQQQLGQSDSWRRYLYLEGDASGPAKPRIQESAFYFSTGRKIDPVAELVATVDAMDDDSHPMGDLHPICRFPSRFLFLQQQLELRPEVSVLRDCPAFSDWAKLSEDSHVTVVMVDGYYGNPASSFGHLIVRVGRGDSSQSLLDNSINYGAQVPEDDNALAYIIKGLVGGYQASFSQENFYRQDLVYARTEYRDMWNYQLALTPEQQLMFVAHIWEAIGQPATYYFVKNNCAYAIAEALEIALDREVVNQNVHWYAPVALLQELEAMDASNEHPALIAQREFLPSQKRQLANILSQLTPIQASVFKAYIRPQGRGELSGLLARLNQDDASATLEALIEYYDYLIQGYPEIGTDLYERRRELLIGRLALPPGRRLQVEEVEPGTPAGQTARTARLTFGVEHLPHLDNANAALIGFAPYQRSPTDRGNDDLSELTALNVRIALSEDVIELDDFTAIRVAQRSNIRQRLPDQWPISWELDVGADCLADCDTAEGLRLNAGLGQSIGIGPLLFSGLMTLSAQGLESNAGGDVEIGLPERAGVAFTTRLGYRAALTDNAETGWRFSSALRLSPGIRHSLLLNNHWVDDDWRHQLSWQWHYR